MHDTQPRVTNGQYGHKDHSSPEVHLAEEVDGSFLFPPSEWPGGAPQYLQFWRGQPISDDALTNFASAYAADWDEWSESLIREHLEVWGNSEEARIARAQTTTREELQAIRNAEHDRYQQQLEMTRPRRIQTGLVRHVARAAQIVYNADRLDSAEAEAAVKASVVYTNGDGHDWTAESIWDRYRLHEVMPDAFYARENALLRKIRSLQQ